MVPFRPITHRPWTFPAEVFPLLSVLLLLYQAAPSAWAQAHQYGIQVSSFQDIDAAVEQVNYLKRLGYPSFYRYEDVDGKGKWYRVYISHFATKEQAEEEAAVLKKLELIKEYKIRELKEGKSTGKDETPSAGKEEQGPSHQAVSRGEKPQNPPKPPTQTKKPSGSIYLLHVCSFKEEENAAKKVRMLEEVGQKAFLVEEELSGGVWYRVYIGKYETEKAARAAGDSLKRTGHIKYFKPVKISRAALTRKSP